MFQILDIGRKWTAFSMVFSCCGSCPLRPNVLKDFVVDHCVFRSALTTVMRTKRKETYGPRSTHIILLTIEIKTHYESSFKSGKPGPAWPRRQASTSTLQCYKKYTSHGNHNNTQPIEKITHKDTELSKSIMSPTLLLCVPCPVV